MASNKKDLKIEPEDVNKLDEVNFIGSVFAWSSGLGWRLLHIRIPESVVKKYAIEEPIENTPAIQINKAGRFAMGLFNEKRGHALSNVATDKTVNEV
jgi:hypothetical protein